LKLFFINTIFAVAKMIRQKFAPLALIFMTFKKFCGIDAWPPEALKIIYYTAIIFSCIGG
jgi:hypothetical protein